MECFHIIKDYQFFQQNTLYLPQINVCFFGQIRKRWGPKDDTVQRREVEGQGLP